MREPVSYQDLLDPSETQNWLPSHSLGPSKMILEEKMFLFFFLLTYVLVE